MTIIINVIGQQIAVKGHKVPLAPHSENFIKLTFLLSSKWKNFKTFAQFRQSNNPPVNVYLDESNSVYVPREIKAGNFTVMLYGAGESIIGTTNCLIFDMVDNCFSADAIETDLTPTLYQQLLNEFKSYLASTKANSESATASENASKSYATAADASAQSATTSANNAIAAEKSAKDSATKANASQTAAKESENNAKASANDAKSAKAAALQAYSETVAAKEGAESAATTASGHVDTAKVYATQAQKALASTEEFEKRASASAVAANASATASATSAGESEQSKTQAQEYAQNAYNSAVGAESAKDDAENARDEIRSMRAEAVTLSPGSDATASYSDGLLSLGIPRGDKGETGATGATGPKGDTGEQGPKGDKGDPGEVTQAEFETAINEKASVIISFASGAIASFPDGAEDMSLKDLKVAIEPVQKGTGDPSPDNVRPISGRTGMTVTRAGKNLSSVNELADQGPQWGSDQSLIKALINTLPVGTYTLSNKYEILEMPSSGKVEHGAIYVTEMINGIQRPVNRYTTVLDNSPYLGKVYEEQAVITITEKNKGKINHTYTFCDQNSSHTGSGRGKYRVFDIQLEFGSTATDYEPYQDETYDITFPSEAGTVYGGSLDVKTGVLTVDKAMVDLGTLIWYAHQSYGFYTVDIINLVKSPSGNAYPVDAMCSQYKVVPQSAESATDASLAVDTTGILYVNDKRYSDATAFKTAVSGVQLAFSITTPITYPLTAHQIKSFYGGNNIWADTGDTFVTYKADTKLYIDKKFTELQALILEN